MKDFRIEYNELLARYNKGISYLEKKPDMIEKWGYELGNIMDKMDKLIKEHHIEGENVLKGFDVIC